jgi:hypothetical protein
LAVKPRDCPVQQPASYFNGKRGEKTMSKLFTCVLAIAVSLGTTAMLANSKRTTNSNSKADATLDADGAFRDGLYLGQLDSASGQPARAAVGRWSTDQDRATFLAGYRRGYAQALAQVEP